MNTKRFEYQHKDVPALKKDVAYRMIFALLFFGVFVWQFVLILLNYQADTVSVGKMAIGALTMLFCLMFALVAILYAMHDLKTLQQIKKRGKSVRVVTVFSVHAKDSLIRLYSFVTKVIALIMLVVVCSSLTYSLLEFIHFSSVSFYLPVLMLLALSGFNASAHMSSQINLMKNVHEYHSIY